MPRRRVPAPWLATGIGLAAASLLVAVLFIARGPEPTAPQQGDAPAHPLEQELLIEVRADGTVHVGGRAYDLRDAERALDGMRQQLASIADALGQRDEQGMGDLRVHLRADPDAPWRHMQWVMQACCAPDVRLWRLRFEVAASEGAVIENDLPVDRGLHATHGQSTEVLKIRLHWTEATTHLVFAREGIDVRGPVEGPRSVLAELQDAVRRALRSIPQDARWQVELRVPPGEDDSDRVPFSAAHAVLEALHEIGITQVVFQGAAVPQ